MDKQAIIKSLTANCDAFVHYIATLTEEEYTYSYEDKWTAGQQLEHLVLSIKPLVQVFSMEKASIAQSFGQTGRASRAYDNLLADYQAKLDEGGKAPGRFVPVTASFAVREHSCTSLTTLVHQLCEKLDTFTGEELDTLQIPHPLLGNLTLREMLYNAIYHVRHHQQQAQKNLGHMTHDAA